jgi:GR25 family glycosyltransferase involved in LPS biosynthesis
MKTFVTTLLSNKDRYDHITNHLKNLCLDYVEIEAIDKNNLTDENIKFLCQADNLQNLESWLTKGNIACVLSKTKAYEEFLKTNENIAFFIEDDVVLPLHIHQILKDIENEILDNEVVLLDFRTVNSTYKIGISTLHAKKLTHGILSFPMQTRGLVGGAAYVITRKVAENLITLNKPVLHTAPDAWDHFYAKHTFDLIRVLYPPLIHFKPFKSAIGYASTKSIIGKIINYVELQKVPFLYSLLQWKRQRFYKSIQKQFYLTEEISPIDIGFMQKSENKKNDG